MIPNPFKDFFYFQKSDRRAIVALGCIAVFCVGVLLVVDRLPLQPSHSLGKEAMQGVGSKPDGLPFTGKMSEGQRGSFDPNTVDSLTLVGFGIKAWKVKNFLHYRAAGKVFRSAEDMGKTYGWTEEDVERVAPYVQVVKGYQRVDRPRYVQKEKRMERKDVPHDNEPKKFQSLTKVDVNEADTALLRRVPGIGEKISEAIVRYRTRLGGFYAVGQLTEIKIVSPELLEWFTISPSPSIQQINLNQASFQQLNSHPYITYEQTKALLQYIRLYGKVEDEETLISTGIFTTEELKKLRPYITYE